MTTSCTDADTINARVLNAINVVRPRYQSGQAMSFADRGTIDDVKDALQAEFTESTLNFNDVWWYEHDSDELADIIRPQV